MDEGVDQTRGDPTEPKHFRDKGSVRTLPTTAPHSLSTCPPGAQQLYSCRLIISLQCAVEQARQGRGVGDDWAGEHRERPLEKRGSS